MRLVLRFEFYSTEELMTVLKHRTKALAWSVEDGVLPLIAQRSRGTPRLALRLLQSARRVARSEGESTITLAHLERACVLEQLDDLGLGPTEQKYLRLLADGATRLNVVASVLGTAGTNREPRHGAVFDSSRVGREGRPGQASADCQRA